MPPYKVGSSDVGAIAFDLPNGTGQINSNLIMRCANASVPLWGGPKGYTDGFTFTDNKIVEPSAEAAVVVDLPRIVKTTTADSNGNGE